MKVNMSGICMLKDIEERLSKCMVDKNELSRAHLFISDSVRTISDDNIHTEADLGQWEILNAEKTNGYTFEENFIYSCNDAAVIEMEMELMEEERDENFLEVYDEIEWHLSMELEELNTILNQLEENKLECKKSHEQALNKYEENSGNLFDAVFREIDELENIHKQIKLDQYLCESPLTALKEKLDCFLESFDYHLRNYFLEATKANGGERCRKVIVEQRLLEERSSAILYENCILQCLLKGQEAALSHISAMTDAIGKDVTSLLKTDIQNEMAGLRNLISVEQIILGFKNDLVSLSHMSANVKTLKHILTMCNSKYNRVNYWCSETEKLTKCTESEKKLIDDVLHLLHSEEEEATKVVCSIKDLETSLKTEHDDAICRTIFMESQLQKPIENSMLHTVLVNILGQFSFDKNISTKLLWKRLEAVVTQIKTSNDWKLDTFFQSFKGVRYFLFENYYLFKLISELRKDSALYCSQVLLNTDTYQQRLSETEKTLSAINQDFIEKQNTLSTNYFMKHRRLLWVYFLCNEEKLAGVLSRANEYLPDV